MPARILYKNILQNADIISGVNHIGDSKDKNATFPRLSLPIKFDEQSEVIEIIFDFGAPQYIEAFGIAGHTLTYQVTGVRVEIAHSNDQIFWITDDARDIENDLTMLMTFRGSPGNPARYWRVKVTKDINLQNFGNRVIGYLSAGNYLEIPRISAPFKNPGLTQGADNTRNYTDEGELLSTDLKIKPIDFELNLKDYDYNWIHDNLPDFVAHASKEPFFFMWNRFEPYQVAYCWSENGEIDVPRFNSSYNLDFNMRFKGFVIF